MVFHVMESQPFQILMIGWLSNHIFILHANGKSYRMHGLLQRNLQEGRYQRQRTSDVELNG